MKYKKTELLPITFFIYLFFSFSGKNGLPLIRNKDTSKTFIITFYVAL